MGKIPVDFEGDTLNGIPHGLCFLNYKHHELELCNFRGVGIMS